MIVAASGSIYRSARHHELAEIPSTAVGTTTIGTVDAARDRPDRSQQWGFHTVRSCQPPPSLPLAPAGSSHTAPTTRTAAGSAARSTQRSPASWAGGI